MKRVAMFAIVAALAFVRTAAADEAADKTKLEELLPKWKEAWNANDMPQLIKLMDPKDKTRKAYEKDEDGKEKVTKEGKELMNQFGAIQKYEVLGYDKQRKGFAVRVTYAKKGDVVGKYVAVQGADEQWYVSVNIDG